MKIIETSTRLTKNVLCIHEKVAISSLTLHNFRKKSYHIQLRDLDIKHLKYWFRISSILERTKNSTKTSNTSFERSDSGFLNPEDWGAWHSYWPATPTLYDKLNFLGKEVVASLWCCQAPVLQKDNCPLSGLSNEILCVFVPFFFSSNLSSKLKVWNFSWLYIIN